MEKDQQYILIYMSHFTGTPDEIPNILDQICEQSKLKNQMAGITGFLFYQNHRFLQVLEGSDQNLKTLYDKLLKDTRHKELRLIEYSPIIRKSLSDWHLDTFDLSNNDTITLEELETFNLQFKHNCQIDSQLFVATLKDTLQQRKCSKIESSI